MASQDIRKHRSTDWVTVPGHEGEQGPLETRGHTGGEQGGETLILGGCGGEAMGSLCSWRGRWTQCPR